MSVHLLMSILMDKNVTIDDVKEMYPNVPVEVIKYIKEKLEKEGKLIIEVEICPSNDKERRIGLYIDEGFPKRLVRELSKRYEIIADVGANLLLNRYYSLRSKSNSFHCKLVRKLLKRMRREKGSDFVVLLTLDYTFECQYPCQVRIRQKQINETIQDFYKRVLNNIDKAFFYL